MKLYKIKNWEKTYENNRTKELKNLTWVPIPNHHDSDGYTLLVSRKDGAAFYGAWVALVQVASKCDPRGTLLRRSGIPHNSESLSRITRIPDKILEEMIFICENECKWLESEIFAGPCDNAAVACDNPAEGCLEGKGREGNRREGTERVCVGGVNRLKKPTLEEVVLFCAKSGIVEMDALWFWNKCEGNGWTNGGRPIRSWRHVLTSWKNANYLPSQRVNGQLPQKPQETLIEKELKRIQSL